MRIKLLFWILLFIPLSNILAQSKPNLYMFIVIQEDAVDVGALDNGQNMELLATKIADRVPSLNVVVKKLSGQEATKEKIERELSIISDYSNDVIWYYYSRHGENYDTWPRPDEQETPLTWVHSKLKEKGVRLTLAIYDCCNFREPTIQPSIGLYPTANYWKHLLLKSKGNYIAAACSSQEFAAGKRNAGSIFTNNFIDAFNCNSEWEDIFTEAKEETIKASERIYAREPRYGMQHPQWVSQNVGNAPPRIASGFYKVRQGERWKDVVTNINLIPDQSTTEEALKAQNPQYSNYVNPPEGAKLKY